MLPSLHTALAFQETKTIEILLHKCREAEQIQWQAQQYCPPPTQPRLVQEPHLSYRRVVAQRPVQVRAVDTEEKVTQDNQEKHNSSPKPSTSKSTTRTCFNCNQPGHLRSNCLQPRKLSCFKCGKDGFTSKNCPRCSKNGNSGS